MGLAVVVVDMCVAYFDRESPLNLDQHSVAGAVDELVRIARANDVPVLWTRVEFPVGGGGSVWYERLSALSSFDKGNRLAEWLPGLEPTEGEVVVTKQHASGFFGSNLADELRAHSVDRVVVCGVSTSGCVRATAIDASAHGFVPYVVKEAVGDRTRDIQAANLFDLHAKYADVISLDDAQGLIAAR